MRPFQFIVLVLFLSVGCSTWTLPPDRRLARMTELNIPADNSQSQPSESDRSVLTRAWTGAQPIARNEFHFSELPSISDPASSISTATKPKSGSPIGTGVASATIAADRDIAASSRLDPASSPLPEATDSRNAIVFINSQPLDPAASNSSPLVSKATSPVYGKMEPIPTPVPQASPSPPTNALSQSAANESQTPSSDVEVAASAVVPSATVDTKPPAKSDDNVDLGFVLAPSTTVQTPPHCESAQSTATCPPDGQPKPGCSGCPTLWGAALAAHAMSITLDSEQTAIDWPQSNSTAPVDLPGSPVSNSATRTVTAGSASMHRASTASEKQELTQPATANSNTATPAASDSTAQPPIDPNPPVLRVCQGAFCTEIRGYGQYELFANQPVSPGQPMLIYCELENFVSQLQTDTNPNSAQFETRLQVTLTIRDQQGRVQQEIKFPEHIDLARNRRRDFYLHVPFYVGQLKSGTYQATVSIEDCLAGTSASFASCLEFVVK